MKITRDMIKGSVGLLLPLLNYYYWITWESLLYSQPQIKKKKLLQNQKYLATLT